MSVTDPISDLLTRIRNAVRSRHTTVEIPASRLKIEMLRILRDQRFIEDYKVSKGKEGTHSTVAVLLKYDNNGRSVITSLERISRPGCRVYLKKKSIQPVLNGFGMNIISTSHGLMTGKEAIEKGIGGEILCSVY
ncbi:MAG TPA: 30S ribosomal protein S8 [Acidobacteriota bacterium]|jgi:small subunit ribosomal protein S8|nr:30S ribosomal protein S8 [Acidobacteriota bacterium]